MNPQRVLFVGHSAALAGAEIAAVNFAAHLDRDRFRPNFLLPRPGPICNLLDLRSIPFYVVPEPSYHVTSETAWDAKANLRAAYQLRESITGLSPDVIVVNTNTIPQAVIATLSTTIPLVVHLHAFVTRRQSLWLDKQSRSADAIWLQFADQIVACSPWVAGFYEELLSREVSVVPNMTHAVKEMSEQPVFPPRFVMFATLDPNKRIDLFFEAALLLHREFPQLEFSCHVYGDGPSEEREKLRSLIALRDLNAHFFLHEASMHTAEIYAGTICAVISSDIEPFSMVAIEAASHARPVIATRSGGPDDIVIDGETGILIEPGNADELAAAMLWTLRDLDGARRMGVAAQARFQSHYAPDVVAPLYAQILEDACSASASHGERRKLGQAVARYFISRGGS